MRVRDFISVVSANLREVVLYDIYGDEIQTSTIYEMYYDIPELLDATIQDIDTFIKRDGEVQFLIYSDFDGTI